MPKTRHYATAPNGQVFHRGSDRRVYSHMVAGRRCRDHALAMAKSDSNMNQDGRNWDYANSKVTGQRSWYDFESEESRQRDRDRVAEGRQNYIDRKRAERILKVSETDFTKWNDLGWASRLDLAQKNAASHRSKPYWDEVVILEAKIRE